MPGAIDHSTYRLRDAVLFAYTAGDTALGVTATRASAATYHAELDDLLVAYQPGGPMTGVTATRASSATYHGGA